MDKNKLMEQLRKAVREVIQEELKHGKSSYDATKGISTTELRDEKGNVVGYIKHKETGTGKKGFVAGGRIGPKAAKAVTAEEKTTINIPVAALPSYREGEQPTFINPKTGEKEIRSDVSSWAKPLNADENKYSLPAGSTDKGKGKGEIPLTAFQRRFIDLKPGETASLKGDPKKVTPTRKKSMEDKARAMGQMDMFTLEEWIGKLEEAGYSLNELSPETLAKYVTRADADLKRRFKQGQPIDNKWKNRVKGVNTALGKLTHGDEDKKRLAHRVLQHRDDLEEAENNQDWITEPDLGKLWKKLRARREEERRNADWEDERNGTAPESPARPAHYHQWTGSDFLLPESYTLEEWIGKLEEEGYQLYEISRKKMEKARDARLAKAQKEEDYLEQLRHGPTGPDYRSAVQAWKSARHAAGRGGERGLEKERDFHLGRANRTDTYLGGKGNLETEPDVAYQKYLARRSKGGPYESTTYGVDEISIDKMVRARDARYYRAQQDAEKARELQKKVHSRAQWRLDHEAGQLRGWAQDERDKAKRTQAHIDRKLAAGKLQERNKENKAKKDAEIADTGFHIRRRRGDPPRGDTPDVDLVKNKQRGRRDAKTVYGDPMGREPGKYLPANMDKKDLMRRDLLKGYARSRVRFGPLSEPKPNLPEEKAHKPKLATSGGTKGPPPEKTKSKSSTGTRTGYGKDTPSYTKPNKK